MMILASQWMYIVDSSYSFFQPFRKGFDFALPSFTKGFDFCFPIIR